MHAKTMPDMLKITRPDDWHVHLRDGDPMRSVVGATARIFGRAVLMPNLDPPITTVAAAAAYRDRVVAALPAGSRFTPLLTLYLTDNTSPVEIERARAAGFIIGVKYYPAGATTNSASGVTALARVYPALAAMEKRGLPLLVHGEVTDPEVDVFDRERVCVERVLARIVRDFPALKLVVEHITTREAAQFVAAAPAHVGATITPQHLLWSRNALFAGGLRPHAYCLPVLKREAHRQALVDAATGGNAKYFLGTDSAPHARHAKESACGCAGCFSAPAGHRALRRSIRCGRQARPARSLRQLPRRGFLRSAPQCGRDHAGAQVLDGAAELSVRRRDGRSAARRRDALLARR